jgi:hypothetical protein
MMPVRGQAQLKERVMHQARSFSKRSRMNSKNYVKEQASMHLRSVLNLYKIN